MSSGMDLEQRLRLEFEQKMQGSPAAIFSDFDTYANTLPRRVVGDTDQVLNLYQLPFWADQQAVRTMALDFESNRRRLEGDRKYVRYATAPTASGKTASILPAFLDSAESGRSVDGRNLFFSYYIYLAFDNNNRRNFRALEVERNHEQHGAAFMLQCLVKFFNNEYGTVDPNTTTTPDIEHIKTEMTDLLERCAPRGRCLVHIDEHRSMISGVDQDQTARFRRGAIQTLAEIPGVVVVATYTKLLTEIDPAGSSKVCRYPVAVPLLDIDAMSKSIPQFDMQLPDRPLTTTEAGILSSVRFRLALKISSIGLLSLHGAVRLDEINRLRRKFEDVVKSTDVLKDRLEGLLPMLELNLSSQTANITSEEEASMMLCGVPESLWSSTAVDRQVRDMLLTPNGYVTTQLKTLLRMTDPTCGVFRFGRDRFSWILDSQDRSLLSSTPLEAAYSWVISTRSARQNEIRFGTHTFGVRCERLSGGRLFQQSFREDFEEQYRRLEVNTFYFALEGTDTPYKQDHPLCDLFFKTADKELVLVDFTAFNDAEFATISPNKLPVKTKRMRMIEWVQSWKTKYNEMGVTLHGVVLAPFNTTDVSGKIIDVKNSVTIICGAEAMEHLGGLSQFLYWFAPRCHVEIEVEDS